MDNNDSPGIPNTFSISQRADAALLNDSDEFYTGRGEKKSSNFQASFTLFKVFVGPGVLALPAAFANVGFLLGIIGIVGAGYLTYYGMQLLLQVAQTMKSSDTHNLQGMTEKIIGRWGKISVEISLVVMQAGIGIAILIFSTKFLNNLVCDFEFDGLCNDKVFLALAALFVVIPLTFINNLHYFYIPSLMATFFVFVNVIVQILYNFTVIADLDASTFFSRMFEFKILNLPLFFGVATYAFEGIGVIFNVRFSMHSPHQFDKVLRIMMLIVTFLYSFFPGTSELAFGQDVPDIILFSLPKTSFYLLMQLLYVISCLLGYPVQIFPVIKIVDSSLDIQKKEEDQPEEAKKKMYYRIAVRLGLIGVMLFIALIAKSFNLFLNLLGSGVFTYLGYLLPIMIYHSYFRGSVPKARTMINTGVFIVGSVLGVLGIIVSIRDIIDYQGN